MLLVIGAPLVDEAVDEGEADEADEAVDVGVAELAVKVTPCEER